LLFCLYLDIKNRKIHKSDFYVKNSKKLVFCGQLFFGVLLFFLQIFSNVCFLYICVYPLVNN